MVLVLAALYTYARYNNHDPCGPVFVPEAGEAAAEGEVAAALSTSLDDSNDSSNSAADQQQWSAPQDSRTHRRSSSLQRLQRRVSDTLQSARHQTNTLLHTTVGRCHSASYYTNTPDEQEEEEEATSALASASASSRGRAQSSSPAASSSSPASASASRLYASIPLQGSSRSYSLLATDHHQTMMEAAMPTTTGSNTTTGTGSSHNRAVPVEDVSLNMFPPSVREEWINAVFGKDYCSSHNNSSPLQQTQKKQQQHQGMGHAGIASYTSYTTTISNPIPQQPHAASSPSSTPGASSTTTTTNSNKVGITISRLPLGAHVRRVAPSSEAALLGIQVGDVLVSINGWNVLCEPSRPLLERLWQYEGVLLSTISISNSSSEIAECKNDSAARLHASQPSGTGSGAARTAAVSSSDSGSTVVAAAAAAAVDSIGNTISISSSNSNNNNSPPCNTTTAATTTTMMTDPVAMTFSRAGQLYQVLFLSCGSWGMAWAPCGNFPLVKRSYGLAAAAGVQRGSILAAVDSVNGGNIGSSSFRDLDHYGMAMKLSNIFQAAFSGSDSGGRENPSLHLTLCFPPRAARPPRSSGGGDTVHSASHSPSPPQPTRVGSSDGTASNGTTSLTRKQRAPQPKRVVKMDDGVEIKFHSLEFALGGICSAVVAPGKRGQYTSSSSRSPTRGGGGGGGGSSSNTDNNNRLSDLAEQVAAGAVESPFVKEIATYLSSSASSTSSSSSPLRLGPYSPCPTLSGKALLDAWKPLESLLYCCAFFKAGYQEDSVQDFFNDCHHQAPGAASISSSNSSRSSSRAPIVALHTLMNTPHAASMASAFLLQFISVICFPHSPETAATATSSAVAEMEEKKSDDVLVQGEQSESSNNKSENSIAKELTSMLLKLSRRDEGFCQRLYFLLRSYISSIETTKRVSTTTLATTTTATTKSSGSSSTTHLLALLNCLELLRFAEKQLHHSNDSNSSSNNNKVPIQNAVSVSPADDLVVATTRTFSNTAIMETSPVPSAVPASPASSASMEESAPAAVSKMKKTSVLHFLRKKKPSTKKPGRGPSSKLHPSNTASKMNMVSPLGDGVGQVIPLTMSNTPVTVVTPSVSQHQHQQYGMSSIMSDDKVSLSQSPSVMYENMSDFLGQLDQVCSTIERSLQRSFRQKIADWAMQPWSASKDSALASVASDMRQSLKQANISNDGGGSQRMKLLVNPVESSELLSSVDVDECYILPSAHFPILLTFNVSERRSCDYSPAGEERIYRTTVKLHGLSNSRDGAQKLKSAGSSSYTVHAAVAGKILASDESLSIDNTASRHAWGSGNNGTLVFDTRSSWGAPQTLSLRLSSSSPTANPTGSAVKMEDATFGWVDLSHLWKDCSYTMSGGRKSGKCQVSMLSLEARDEMIDEHGEASDQQHDEQQQQANRTELELEVSTEFVDFGDSSNGDFARKRMLLYKHDDDLRQEDFAVQFIRTCDNILQASGLDMKLLTFNCIPVGTRRGFVEWVPGSVPLSEVCQPFLDSILESSDTKTTPATDADGRSSPSMFAKAGLTKYESLFRLGGSLQSESLRRLAGAATAAAFERGGLGSSSSFANNPVQDYLRSVAYAQDAPYLIRREVMDTYVKSCAGYSVITYILGVGDRHLDNLLLHQSGSFFHCDYSFLLGSDPKKYLPMRITEDMVNGMGGKWSDNYAKFLSLTSAAFLALRRPEIVRILLSLVRLLECSNLPDMSESQSMDQAVLGMRDRLRLDLREDEAVAFMEHLIEDSLNSKLWLAVDAMHSLGKKF